MGESVYRGYDAEAFERQYNARVLVPDSEQIVARNGERSAAYRARARAALDLAYGPARRERLDVFRGAGEGCPVLLYIHGGYWRSRDKESFSFLAEPLVAAGATVVVVSYSHCPHVTVDHVVGQMRAACRWIHANARAHGGDPARLHVCGNSAGGHLAAMLAATDWPALDSALPADLVKSATSLSGLFDLEPLPLHSINDTLGLDAAAVARLSPIRLAPTLAGPVTVAVGGDESEEFRRQSRDFAAAWRAAGADAEYLELPGLDHFTIVSELGRPDYAVTRRLVAHMGLA